MKIPEQYQITFGYRDGETDNFKDEQTARESLQKLLNELSTNIDDYETQRFYTASEECLSYSLHLKHKDKPLYITYRMI